MTSADTEEWFSPKHLSRMRHRARILLLLEAAERAGITPLASARLHALAYLADVLSPVWNLIPFDGKIYKSEGGPHYSDLQYELDQLVVLGLVEISRLRYLDRGKDGARLDADYALNFSSVHLEAILNALGTSDRVAAIDPGDRDVHAFLVELAGALATLPDDEIEVAAGQDVTYRVEESLNSVVDFAEWAEDQWKANPSWQAAERFRAFLPRDASLSPGEKLYLYAAYLGRALHAA